MCKHALDRQQLDAFRQTGHLTVHSLFDAHTIESVLDDLMIWSAEFMESLTEEKQRWFVERNGGATNVLRKLDNPAFHREPFAKLATHPSLVPMIQQLIGEEIHLFFGQVFMKPPEVGGPKPIHQDNYYFGPDDLNATLTVWIALDDATTSNGCLHYCNQHQDHILPHVAPVDEPFNLQISGDVSDACEMHPAPIKSGGVSFHHGNTPHFSAENRSRKPRRAVAFHYLRNDARLVNSGLSYDPAMRIAIS
tara:strand:+ start:381 stop:1130 length:750 start_codon:yes stop_codon:yes gene_type:complete